MPTLKRMIRNGSNHIQVDAVTGSGKSRLLPMTVAETIEQLHGWGWKHGKTLVLTPSTVDVTGMWEHAKAKGIPSRYCMGCGRTGGLEQSRSHEQVPHTRTLSIVVFDRNV